MEEKDLLEQVLDIDKELEEIFKRITHGLPYKLFRKKIVAEVLKNDYYSKLELLLSKMSNSDLLVVMNVADYVIKIIYVPKYLSEAFVDYEKIKNDPDYLIQAYNNIVDQHEAIASMSRDKDYYEIIKEKSNIEKIEKYLLEAMTNEQIHELANSSKDWQEKLYFYGFLKDGSKPCKFKKQREKKYYVLKVKYITKNDKNEYYYICNYENIKKGDKVIVTSYTGHSYDLKVAKVLDSSYYEEKDLPISIADSEEVVAKANEIEEFGGKYSFGKLKFYDDKGKEVPFFDADLDRQSYLSSLKIADQITDRLSDNLKKELSNIPNFELVPRSFKQMILDEYIVYEPKHIKELVGAEDEISDYILFNVKNPEIYETLKAITDSVVEDLDENDFENLLNDTFVEDNSDFIKYIENNFVKGKHNLEKDDEWIAEKVFNKTIVELQKISKFKQEQEKYDNSLYKFNFRDINRKVVLLEDTREQFDNYGIKKLKNPFLAYVYIDIDRGLNARIIGNVDDEKLNKELCSEKVYLIRHDLFLNYKASIFDKKINTFDLEKQMDTYYSDEDIENIRKITELDKFRSKEYPDDIEILIPLEDNLEKIWVRLYGYNEKEDFYMAVVLNDSFEDSDIIKGTIVACKHIKTDNGDFMALHGILKKVNE